MNLKSAPIKHSHFTDDATEAQRGKENCPGRTSIWKWAVLPQSENSSSLHSIALVTLVSVIRKSGQKFRRLKKKKKNPPYFQSGPQVILMQIVWEPYWKIQFQVKVKEVFLSTGFCSLFIVHQTFPNMLSHFILITALQSSYDCFPCLWMRKTSLRKLTHDHTAVRHWFSSCKLCVLPMTLTP